MRVSRRKVGKIANVSASASSRDASAPNVASPSGDQAAQLAVLARDGVEDPARVAEHLAQRHLLLGQRPQQVGAARRRTGAALPSESLKSRAKRPEVTMPASCSHCWKASRVFGSNTRKTSSSSTVSSTFACASVPPSSRLSAPGLPGRELHVGLAEKALLAQDRPCVAADRREAVVDLDLHRVRAAARPELLVLDLADVHARHPDVGLLHQQRGLGEVRLEAVALRAQRQRSAEGGPQEHQESRHGQGEPDHCGDACGAWWVLVHGRSGGTEGSGRIGPPPPLPGGGAEGSALKLQEPNWVARS